MVHWKEKALIQERNAKTKSFDGPTDIGIDRLKDLTAPEAPYTEGMSSAGWVSSWIWSALGIDENTKKVITGLILKLDLALSPSPIGRMIRMRVCRSYALYYPRQL